MVAAVALSVAMLVSVTTLAALGDSSNHFLDSREDEFKTQFISGNLTASMTRDWPMVDFQHSDNWLAALFEIRWTRLFLFNDTNGDGVFSRSEATFTGFLDSEYTDWNMTDVEYSHSGGGETASVEMSAAVSLFRGYTEYSEDDPDVSSWARMSLSYAIAESSVTRTNSFGQYVVAGKTDLQVRINIEILRPVNAEQLALEQKILGGGSVHHFLLRERATKSDSTLLTSVPYRIDERDKGLNFTHRLHQTSMPTQDVQFAREDGAVQAYYRFSSEPTTEVNGSIRPALMNTSYYTTGASLVINPSYRLENGSDNLTHDMSLGLDMSGFVRVRDWVADNLPVLVVIGGGLVALTIASVHVWRGKRRRLLEDRDEMKLESEKGTSPK